MIIGFHYHSPFVVKGDKIFLPGNIGVFVDELAKQTKHLYLFLEEQTDIDSVEEDHEIQSNNITLISLGPKSTFYKRLLAPKSKLDIIAKHIHLLDHFLLRSPSPLCPHIYFRFHKKCAITNLLVGNYINGLKSLKQPPVRKVAIVVLMHYYQWLQNKMIRNSDLIANSIELGNENKKRARSIHLVKTTTISKETFFYRSDTFQYATKRILFTGRINFQKGLRELISAIAILDNSPSYSIDIVGWEEPGKFSYTNALKDLAKEKGISTQLHFHGKKKVGEELNQFYRNADLFVLPTYHEGFPRTIWEALANGLPVIASKVGSIPHYLSNKENALLIEPKHVTAIVEAIKQLESDPDLRKKIIKNGYEIVETVTLEEQTKLLINILRSTNQLT
jgi:glycosyltransferase involved in cell wall biosynthesis